MKNTKNFKKFTAVLLAVIFAFSIFTAVTIGTNAAEEATKEVSETSGDFYYYDTTAPSSGKGSIVIAGYDGSATDLTIPSTIDGRKVYGIGSNAFEDCKTLRSVTISNGITEIYGGAFKDCTNLRSVTIPNSVTSIEGNAFEDCTNLRNITIPDSVTSIGDYAFKNCKNLENVTIPDSVTSIGAGAFDGTAWYNNQFDGLVYAGNVAYKYKGSMPTNTSIVLKNGTTGVSGEAFYDCSNLKKLTIPDSIVDIGFDAFYNCKIKELVIADGSKEVTESMMIDNIHSGSYDASDPTRNNTIENIVIPNSVEKISDGAFEGYIALKKITIPDSVTSIGDGAFYYCCSLTSMTIPDSVTSISDGAFYHCCSLTSITIPDSVTSIGDGAFYYCCSLTSISIPNSVTNIGERAFEKCSNLTSGNIGYDMFYRCDNLASINVSDDNSLYSSENGVLYNKNKSKIFKYPAAKAGESYTIPNSVKVIDDYAFESCKNLKKVTIPESVGSIGENAFSNCSGLTIYGYADSTAEIYALKHNINFVELKAEPTTPTTPTNPTEPTTPTTPTTPTNPTEPTTPTTPSTSTSPTDPVTPTKIGDVNGDGKVDINDATTVQKGIAQLITLNEAQMKVADVTGDGKVDINDVTTIQKFIAQLITDFSAKG